MICTDGPQFWSHHIVSAVGVGSETGATENASALKCLLSHLRDHGFATHHTHLFVIDGAKALRAALDEVFGFCCK